MGPQRVECSHLWSWAGFARACNGCAGTNQVNTKQGVLSWIWLWTSICSKSCALIGFLESQCYFSEFLFKLKHVFTKIYAWNIFSGQNLAFSLKNKNILKRQKIGIKYFSLFHSKQTENHPVCTSTPKKRTETLVSRSVFVFPLFAYCFGKQFPTNGTVFSSHPKTS